VMIIIFKSSNHITINLNENILKSNMFQERKKRPPSDYYCVVCGRNTNDKKIFVDEWGNQFFSCKSCRQVWCANCMGQITGIGASKTYKLGKKGKINCPNCNQFVPMIKLPFNLPFVQAKIQQSSIQADSPETKFCVLCGHEINKNAKYCENCGGEQ